MSGCTKERSDYKNHELKITPDKLKCRDISMQYLVDPKLYTVLIGASSDDKNMQFITFTVNEYIKL